MLSPHPNIVKYHAAFLHPSNERTSNVLQRDPTPYERVMQVDEYMLPTVEWATAAASDTSGNGTEEHGVGVVGYGGTWRLSEDIEGEGEGAGEGEGEGASAGAGADAGAHSADEGESEDEGEDGDGDGDGDEDEGLVGTVCVDEGSVVPSSKTRKKWALAQNTMYSSSMVIAMDCARYVLCTM